MTVWRARVDRLPLGVEASLPLLQSKVLALDTHIQEGIKVSQIGTAIARFTGYVVKDAQNRYYSAIPMHYLASDISLPHYLVDLRNEVIHGKAPLCGLHSLTAALDIAWCWIKNYYWDKQYKKFNRPAGELVPISEKVTSHEEYSVSCRIKDVMSASVAVFKSGKYSNGRHIWRKAMTPVVESVYMNGLSHMDLVIHALIHTMLLPDDPQLLQKYKTKTDCLCGSAIFRLIAVGLQPVLVSIYNVEGMGHLVNQLATEAETMSEDYQDLAKEWIRLILQDVLGNVSGRCQHSLDFKHKERHSLVKQLLYALLSSETTLGNEMALWLLESPKSELDPSQQESIRKLMNIYHRENDLKNVPKQQDVAEQVVYDVNAVLQASKRRILRQPMADDQMLDEEDLGVTPLGRLANQGPNYYHELLLEIPLSSSH
ncbi:uncharacterized protein LOC143041335 isoform X2 [Oratosquilla oratoria]